MVVDWMRSVLLYEFNVELSFVVPFSTPSEALGGGTWRSIFLLRYISNGLGWIWFGWAAIRTFVRI